VARLISSSAASIVQLVDGWECTSTPQGAAGIPEQVPSDANWIPARVPGTYATALRAAGLWNGIDGLPLDDMDIWYRTNFSGGEEEALCFEGLATVADVWLNGHFVLHSNNMFLPCQGTVRTLATNELYICFRSLSQWLRARQGRARWRSRIASPPTLRFSRTTLLGRMSGWCPTVHPVGPWRAILRRRRTSPVQITELDARASVRDGDGYLDLRCIVDANAGGDVDAAVDLGEDSAKLVRVSPREFAGRLVVPRVALWWPHTHGVPHLYPAKLRLGDLQYDLGRIGFRQIDVDHGADGNQFCLRVNGVPVFCRGACWTTPDLVSLPSEAQSHRPWLEAMRDAGLNMVRVGGTMVYEADSFYALCDELGLLVWQDAMLANFDYPHTSEFQTSLAAELEHFLDRTQLIASLAVFCGGSEVLQQARMFGLHPDKVDDRLYRTVIPEVLARSRPDVVYVCNSPSGGDLPFQPNVGIAHYYGVGAYLRPLSDARSAEVKFAAECLALANVPCARTVDEMGVTSTTEPRWKRAVPRDPGAGWDFDDVRDHYLARLFKVDPLRLRYADFARYLELSRAVSCILMEEVIGEWRRSGSTCRGALVWQWQDVAVGAGWGVIDSLGRRKAAWYGLQRASRPRQVVLTDEGLNGLHIHIINESDAPLHGRLTLTCFKDSATPVRKAEQVITIEPRSAVRLASGALMPDFFDITYAYRFGPLAFDATVASLYDALSGAVIAEACHFPDNAALAPIDPGLEVAVEHDADGWALRLLSRRFVRFLHIEDTAFIPTENWVHLPPNREARIALSPGPEAGAKPEGEVHGLNMDRIVRYSGRTLA
jgi:beta-mannosidase